jgi:hypothetical protein
VPSFGALFGVPLPTDSNDVLETIYGKVNHERDDDRDDDR